MRALEDERDGCTVVLGQERFGRLDGRATLLSQSPRPLTADRTPAP